MEEVALDIYGKVIKQLPNDTTVVFDCGHFDSVLGVDDFSTGTAQLAVALFDLCESQRRKGLKVVFAVLLDDVGMSCDQDAMICLPKDVQQISRTDIPEDIIKILSPTVGFRKERAKLFSEKTARNRGLQYFRKHLNNILEDGRFSLIDREDGKPHLYFRTLQGHNILMADLTTDAVWTGHCPLLMGMHYRDVATWAHGVFPNSGKVAIVDFSLSQDRGKVNGGAQICIASSDTRMSIRSVTNICFADEDLDIYTIDTYGEGA